jgi:hypothetical protein
MPRISQEQAVALAKAFVAAKPRLQCGALASVKHSPPASPDKGHGQYHVEFAYAGPPVEQVTRPRRDHPTIVFVDDETGDCRLMYWM